MWYQDRSPKTMALLLEVELSGMKAEMATGFSGELTTACMWFDITREP